MEADNWAFDHVKEVREHDGHVDMMLDRDRGVEQDLTWQKGEGNIRQAEEKAYAKVTWLEGKVARMRHLERTQLYGTQRGGSVLQRRSQKVGRDQIGTGY